MSAPNEKSPTRLVRSQGKNYLLRPATREDLPFVIAVLRHDSIVAQRETPHWDPHLLPRHYREAFEQIQLDPNNFLMVFEHEGILTGTFQMTFLVNMTYEGGLRLQLEGVRVMDQSQGRKLGNAMFEGIKALAKANSCSLIQLTCDRQRVESVQFYQSLGYSDSHIGFKLNLSR